jgi:hypothetical protein
MLHLRPVYFSPRFLVFERIVPDVGPLPVCAAGRSDTACLQNGVLSKFESPAHAFGVDEILDTHPAANRVAA